MKRYYIDKGTLVYLTKNRGAPPLIGFHEFIVTEVCVIYTDEDIISGMNDGLFYFKLPENGRGYTAIAVEKSTTRIDGS